MPLTLSQALRSVSAYVQGFSRIVPRISSENKTALSDVQLQALYNAGCSPGYLVTGEGRKFTYSKRGRALQALYEQQSSENFTRNLNTLIERNIFSHSFTTICENSSLEQH